MELEEYCPAVEKLLEATAAMSLAVEKQPTSPREPSPLPNAAPTVVKSLTSPMLLSSDKSSTKEVEQPQVQTDRRQSYSQNQRSVSSLDTKPPSCTQNQRPASSLDTIKSPSYFPNQRASSSLDVKPALPSSGSQPQQQQKAIICSSGKQQSRPAQTLQPQDRPKQSDVKNQYDRRFSLACGHIGIANHISSSYQGMYPFLVVGSNHMAM